MCDGTYKYLWIYICGPYLGGFLAGIFHLYHTFATLKVLGNPADNAMKNAEEALI